MSKLKVTVVVAEYEGIDPKVMGKLIEAVIRGAQQAMPAKPAEIQKAPKP
jgi:hypothetical protein